MYGIVNQAIQGLVIDSFGKQKWEEILHDSKVDIDSFSNKGIYPDKITYDLAISASRILNMSLDDVLFSFGKYWVLHIANLKYNSLLKTGGNHAFEFLKNLPNFHSRVMLYYPDIEPPEFQVEEIDNKTLILHYYSFRSGLSSFVKGIVIGLGDFFGNQIVCELIDLKEDQHTSSTFKIKWLD